MSGISPTRAVLLATAVATVVVLAGGATLWLVWEARLPRVPDSVVEPVKRAAPVRFDGEATNPTDDWYYRYLVLDTPAGVADTVTWCLRLLTDKGWSRDPGLSVPEVTKNGHVALVVDVREFGRTMDPTERILLTEARVDLAAPGCVVIVSP